MREATLFSSTTSSPMFRLLLRERDGIIEDFDDSLWGGMVEYVTVGRKKEMTVTFRDGTEIQA